MKRSWPLVALLLSAGCSINAPIQRLVVDQNTVLARTTDEVMLVNLLRAKNNAPMHFSLVSQFHGNAQLTAGMTLGTTFPGNGVVSAVTQGTAPGTTVTTTPGVNTLVPGISAQYSEMPSFDSNVIDSQSFFQGFLKPVDETVVGHFLYDGWSPRLLTYLLVKRFSLLAAHDYDHCGNPIEKGKPKIACKDEKADADPLIRQGELVAYMDNSIFAEEAPDGRVPATPAVNPFVSLVDHFMITGVSSSKDQDTPLFAIRDVSSLAGIDKIDGHSFDWKNNMLTRKGGSQTALILSRYQGDAGTGRLVAQAAAKTAGTAAASAPEYALPFVRTDLFKEEEDRSGTCRNVYDGQKYWACAAYIPTYAIYTPDEVELEGNNDQMRATYRVHKTVDGTPIAVNVQLVLQAELRSPESVFFFVGEYLRKMSEEDLPSGRAGAKRFLVPQDWPWAACNAERGGRSDADQPLIVVTDKRPKNALLSAELDGTRYYIPDSRDTCNGQSMKVLTLLEQVFYLQVSSADKLGLTPTVHVVP